MVVQASSLASVGQFIGMRTSQIAGTISEFIRTNPIITGAAFGGSILGGFTALQTIRRVRKRRKTKVKRKKTSRKRVSRRRTMAPRRKKRRVPRGRAHKSHSRPRHAGHRIVSFRNKTTGKMVRFKVKNKSKGRRK